MPHMGASVAPPPAVCPVLNTSPRPPLPPRLLSSCISPVDVGLEAAFHPLPGIV
jgi:hypothetical protein